MPRVVTRRRLGRIPPGVIDPPGMTLILNEDWSSGTIRSSHWGNPGEGSTFGQPSRVGRWLASQATVEPASPGGVGDSLFLRCSNNETGTDGGSQSRWLGAMVTSRSVGVYYPRYGRYEIRARLHHGQGVWPAFWLTHINGGASTQEVDIMEYFHAQTPGHTVGVLHRTNGAGVFQSNVNPSPRFGFFENVAAEGAQGWHTFAVDIRANASNPNNVDYSWLIDGTVFESFTDTDAGFYRDLAADPDHALGILLQGAQIGGTFAGHPNGDLGENPAGTSCLIGGTPPNCTTTFSGQSIRRSELADIAAGGQAATVDAMEVDYVRVWRWDG